MMVKDDRFFQAATDPVFDDDGRLSQMTHIMTDITDIKQAEQSLRKSEERYKLLIESMHEGISMVDEQGIVTYINDQCCAILGYPRPEILGKHWTVVWNESARAIIAEQLQRCRQGMAERKRAGQPSEP